MEIAKGKYKLRTVIAAGSYGRVFEDRQYAIKQMKLPSNSISQKAAQSITATLTNQIQILTQLNHPNIVKLYQVVQQNNAIYIIMELCESDLRILTETGPCGEKKSHDIMKQIISGYRQLMKINIVHRDLKPANILLDKGVVKLADFGVAKSVTSQQQLLLRSHVGTPYYMAPQILQRIQYSRKCDIWSLGIIFYELLLGKLPWTGKNEYNLLENIMNIPLAVPSYISQPIRQILEQMLSFSEEQRIGWDELQKKFELYERIDAELEEKNYHWSLVHKMVLIQADRQSHIQYKRTYGQLTISQKQSIQNILRCLFREQQSLLLQYLNL